MKMTLEHKQLAGYISVAIWMVVIFLFSNQDASISLRQSGTIVDFISSFSAGAPEGLLTFLTRKAAHIFAYFVLGILIYNVIKSYPMRMVHMISLGIVLCCVYALSDELHQTFIPGRSGELRDVLIDTTASFVGIMAYIVIEKVKLHKEILFISRHAERKQRQ